LDDDRGLPALLCVLDGITNEQGADHRHRHESEDDQEQEAPITAHLPYYADYLNAASRNQAVHGCDFCVDAQQPIPILSKILRDITLQVFGVRKSTFHRDDLLVTRLKDGQLARQELVRAVPHRRGVAICLIDLVRREGDRDRRVGR
jgi:hypothetical protein